jgi:hypothetical protein
MLFGVMPGDSLSFAGTLLSVTLVALAASAIPRAKPHPWIPSLRCARNEKPVFSF